MKPLFDLHTHTIASGHAYSSLKENIEAAAERGLTALGISDHAPAMPGTCHSFHFGNYKVIRESLLGIRIVKGIEANILDFDGSLDVGEDVLGKLEYAIASLHPPCIPFGTMEQNTRALIGAMANPYVKIIGHPDDDRYPLDYEEVVLAAQREKVALEINNSSFCPGSGRQNGGKNARIMLEVCRRFDVPVVLGSDAHIWYDVGEMGRCRALLREVGFPPELVLNYSPEGLDFLLNRKRDGSALPVSGGASAGEA
ncbi:MAG: phosphatase [Synergistales bacterium]|nr:phosphatase [Synergistales bacterium]